MSAFMKNTKIGTRIIIALAFPVVAMLVFSGFMVVEKYQTKKEMGRVLELAELAPVISAVAHELQKERGMSAGFIASKGVKFARDLPEQRKLTNEKRTAMAEALKTFDAESFGDGISENIAEAKKALGNLASKRTDVTARKITVPQMAGYYTPTIGALLHIVEDMSGLSTEFHITTAINAYTAFLQGKERAGIERAMGAGGFGAHQFKPVIHHKFVQLIAMQKTFLGRFNIHASQEQKAFYKSTMTGPVVDEVNRMRKIAIDSPITGSTGDVDATHWFKTITAKINLLKTVEDKIASDLQASTAAIETAALTAFIVLAVITLVLMILTAAMVYYVVTGITRPLADMTDAMSALAEGDKKVEVPGTDRGDEIGAMAETVQVFKDNMIRAEQLAAKQKLAEEAEKRREQEDRAREEEDRARELDERTKEEVALKQREERTLHIETLNQKFDHSVADVLGAVSEATVQLKGNAESMSSTAEETSRQSQAVAAASEQASTNVQTVASAAEELSASIDEISRQVSKSSEISGNAVDKANNADEMIQGLAASAEEIGDVVALITGIAEQTNLLALNATIESARAGDAGKGFAVVANEVKTLAAQTASATENISRQIAGIQSSTGQAVTAVQGIATTINEVNEISTAIASAVEEQSSATQEIARNVEQASAGTTEVTSNITGVQTAAGETGQAATEVMEASTDLTSKSEELKGLVESYLNEIKAA